jgi:hypothetical protein
MMNNQQKFPDRQIENLSLRIISGVTAKFSGWIFDLRLFSYSLPIIHYKIN